MRKAGEHKTFFGYSHFYTSRFDTFLNEFLNLHPNDEQRNRGNSADDVNARLPLVWSYDLEKTIDVHRIIML